MGKYAWSDKERQRREDRRPAPVRIAVPIKVLSVKREKLQREYVAIVEDMLKEDPTCHIREVGCTGLAEGLHHMGKRSPDTITDRSKLKRACNNCNEWCELYPLEAIAKGHSISKHIKPDNGLSISVHQLEKS